MVISGKGGVGKSTVACGLAMELWRRGARVGVLDVDICGPSVPRMLGVQGREVFQAEQGWMPVVADANEEKRLVVMSISFLMSDDSAAVIWRGPRKTGMIGQMLSKVVCWGNLDYLIIDTPPGTSDEHLSCLELLQREAADKLAGAVLVTTPQRVAICDVRREIAFCRMTNLPILGLIENMSGYRCPHCDDCTRIFASGGGESLAKEKEIPFLGRLVIDPVLIEILDSNGDFCSKSVYQSKELSFVVDTLTKCL